ncbi:MAG: putative porin [Flavobacteriaceae bacterium]
MRKDDFELMPFANLGQPYNSLGVDFKSSRLYPRIGALAKHFNYMELEDIAYYHVATPMSDLFFKTTLEQGQLLDATVAVNTSERFNFSLAYKGFRSLGKYVRDQVDAGNFRATFNYVTKNGRYGIRGHTAVQDLNSEEHGGLTKKEEQFESANPDFSERSRIDVRFTGNNSADSKLLGKRYYIDHWYKLIKKAKDSSDAEQTSLSLGHRFGYETQLYQFSQGAANTYFGDAFVSPISDQARLKVMDNEVSARFYNRTLGSLEGNLSAYDYNYYFNSKVFLGNGVIENQLTGTQIAVGGKYAKRLGGFDFNASFKQNLSGELGGRFVEANASYALNDRFTFSATLYSSARMPNFNYLLYQSDYRNYNWQHTDTFKKEQINALGGTLESKKWGRLSATYTNIDKYAYFAPDPDVAVTSEEAHQQNIAPFQDDGNISYLKLKYEGELRYGAFALNNTVMYQTVSQSNKVLNLPQLVTRNTLYYSTDVFKKAMYIHTGITLKYFSSYHMDAYNPLLGEFYVQTSEKLGGFPMLDFFINGRVQQTRIYLKAEHFNSSFGKTNKFYSAPDYPYRDFVIRFGLVWNFFS